jgi:hypothetical protein
LTGPVPVLAVPARESRAISSWCKYLGGSKGALPGPMPNAIGYTRRRGTDARFLSTVGRVSGLSEQTEIVDGVNTAGLLLHKPQLREPRLRVRDRAKPFRTSLRSLYHPTSPPKSISGSSSTAGWGGRVKIWGEWLDECETGPVSAPENRLAFGRLGSAIGLHNVLIPLQPPAF